MLQVDTLPTRKWWVLNRHPLAHKRVFILHACATRKSQTRKWQWLWKARHNQEWGINFFVFVSRFSDLNKGGQGTKKSSLRASNFECEDIRVLEELLAEKCYKLTWISCWLFFPTSLLNRVAAAEPRVIAQYWRAHWPHARWVFFFFCGGVGVSAQRTHGIWGSHSLWSKLCRTRLSPGLWLLLNWLWHVPRNKITCTQPCPRGHGFNRPFIKVRTRIIRVGTRNQAHSIQKSHTHKQ